MYNSFIFANIELKFLRSYTQIADMFETGLSILDIMIFNSPTSINEMPNNIELIK